MFGALMGTLNSFQKQSSKDSKLAKQSEQRAQIDARVKQKVAKEKAEIAATKEKTIREQRERNQESKMLIETELVWLWL
jgi:hypothetical protein